MILLVSLYFEDWNTSMSLETLSVHKFFLFVAQEIVMHCTEVAQMTSLKLNYNSCAIHSICAFSEHAAEC